MLERIEPYVTYFIKRKIQNSNKKPKLIYSKFFEFYLKKYQLSKIKSAIKYSYNTSPFYRELFDKNNLKPSDIKSFSDLTKIPLTDPKDLAKNPKRFFSVSEDKFIKVFTTSGTTGKPKKAYFTKKDIDKIILSTAIGAKLLQGITNKDRIRLTFEVGYGTEIWSNRFCLDNAYSGIVGAMTITTGRLSIEEELEMIKEHKPNVFGDVTSRINYLTNELKKRTDLKKLGIKKFLIGAEPTPKSIRDNIEKSWGAQTYVGYGITEVGLLMAGECKEKNGMHLSETNFYTEVIDHKTGKQVKDGEIGELVFTTFDREGMPLIRYNSHDLGKIIPEKCKCGIPFRRIEIKGRSDDLIPIGAGDNLFAKMFDNVLFKIPKIIDYKVFFDKKDGKDLITIVVETNNINDNKLKEKIIEEIMKIPEINSGINNSKTVAMPQVRLVKSNTFERKSIKTRRFIDNRNLYDSF